MNVTIRKPFDSTLASLMQESDEPQRLFDRIMAASPDLVYLYDIQADRNIYANRALSTILGYTPEQVQAMANLFLPSILHPEERERLLETLQRLDTLPDGEIYEHNYHARHSNGSWRLLHDRSLVFERTTDGKVRLILGIVQDITERHELERTLEERSSDMATFLETMPIAVLVGHDAAGTQITGNTAAEVLLRAPQRSNLSLTAPPEERATIHTVRRAGRVLSAEELPMQYAGSHGVPVEDPELEVLFTDGEVKYIAGYVSPLFSVNGETRGSIAAYVDVTESRRMRLVERLYAGLSAIMIEEADYISQLERVAQLTVPDLADFCLLDLIDENNQIVRKGAAHAEPASQRLVEILRRYPPLLNHDTVLTRVLCSGEPLFIPEVPQQLLDELAQDEIHRTAIQTLLPRSSMIVPLNARGATIGTLTLSLTDPVRRYTARDFEVANEVASRIALAIDNARLSNLTRQHAARMQALAEVSRLLAESSLDQSVLLKQLATEIATRIGDACLIYLLSDDRQWLVPVAIAHQSAEAQALLKTLVAQVPQRADEGLAGRAVQEHSSLLMARLKPEEAAAQVIQEYQPYLIQYGIGSALAVPLWLREQVIGSIFVARNSVKRPYLRDDKTLLQDVADRASLAINHARLYSAAQQARAEAEQSARRVAQLQAVTGLLSTALTVEQVAEIAVHQGLAVLEAVAGSVVMYDQEEGMLHVVAAAGYPAELVSYWTSFPVTVNTPLSEAVQHGRPVWIESPAERSARYPELAAHSPHQRDQAWAAIPLMLGQQVLGGLGLSFAEPRVFQPEDKALVINLAQQCAQAFKRAQLYEAEQRARAEAEAAVRVRDRFLSVVAEALKKSLTPLLGQAQLLLRRAMSSEEGTAYQRSAQVIISQANRLDRLISSLLDLNRLQAGRLRLMPVPLDLSAFIERLAEEFHPAMASHTLQIELPDEVLMVKGDELRLEQVLQNLLQNAVKYSQKGSTITLRVLHDAEQVRVEVSDEGIGIPAESIPSLFTPFYRAANAESSAVEGVGVGLAVVKDLIELHGGSIAVTSVEGSGSTFTFWLPLLKA